MSKFKVFILLNAGVLFYCYEFFLRILTGAYREQIINHFDITTNIGFSFLISSYNITYLLMQIPAGIILDRYGSKKTLICATLICGIGNIIFIYGGFNTALLGRLLVGVGSSFAFIGVLKLTIENFNAKHFAIITSLVISLGTLTAAFSQNISLFISSLDVSWIHIFVYSGVMSIPLAILLYFCIPTIDNPTNIMPKFKDIFAVAKVLARNKLLWSNAIWAGLIYIPTIVLTSQYGVLYFSETYGLDSIQAGIMITSIFMGWVMFSPIITTLGNRINTNIIIYSTIFMATITILALNFGVFKGQVILVAFIFGSCSASQVLVWYFFNKSCPVHIAAVGIAFTNMIITAVTEIGQLGTGLAIDFGDIFSIKSNVSISICFIISLILGAIVFKYGVANKLRMKGN
jgi:MFS family permease